jgi:hypothetical protein
MENKWKNLLEHADDGFHYSFIGWKPGSYEIHCHQLVIRNLRKFGPIWFENGAYVPAKKNNDIPTQKYDVRFKYNSKHASR